MYLRKEYKEAHLNQNGEISSLPEVERLSFDRDPNKATGH